MRKLTTEDIFEHAKYTKANNLSTRGVEVYSDKTGYLFSMENGMLKPLGVCVPELKSD